MMINPLLLELPDTIETERLILSVPSPENMVAKHSAINESIHELGQWMDWVHNPHPLEDVIAYNREAREKFLTREHLTFDILLKENNQYAGSSGIHSINWFIPSGEIGYWLRTSLVGNGYITEAVNALTAYAFEYMKVVRMEIRCDSLNERSAAVARRAGYRLDATLRDHRRAKDGTLHDTLVFAMLRGKEPD